jgi:hypothetical protein
MTNRQIAYVFAAISAVGASSLGCSSPAGDRAGSEDQAQIASAGDRYYMAMFGYQDAQNSAQLSHTFASFVHVPASGDAPEVRTISWLPEAFDGQVYLAHLAETGHNYTVEETLGFALQGGESIGMWGPFAISQDIWYRANVKADGLDNHQFLYKAFDLGARWHAENCIHAVTDVMRPGDRTGLNWGWDGSKVALQLFVNPQLQATEPDAVGYFGIDTYLPYINQPGF